MQGPDVHIGPGAEAEQAERDRKKNLGKDKQLYGVAPEVMQAAMKHAIRKLSNDEDAKRRKAKNRKKGAAAKKARRANRRKK